MKRPTRLTAITAAIASLAFVAVACSPKSPASDQASVSPSAPATSATPVTAVAATDPPAAQSPASGLPGACQSLLAAMQSCSDNLTRQGSPLGNQIRLSMDDMRQSIARAPSAEVAAFCDTEASAFKQRAQASHC